MLRILNAECGFKLVQKLKYTVLLSPFKFHRITRGCSSKRVLAAAYKPAQVEADNRLKVRERPVTAATEPATGGRRKQFSLLLPPPNVTGELHLGHALTCTLQDVMVRWKEKQGYVCLWTPGMDHAGIATQVVVEKKLRKERNLSRHDLGRERFLEEVWAWKEANSESIRRGLKGIGSRMDWHKEYFTMDDRQSHAVKAAFVRLFEKDLIYRNKALVNWSCSLESAISDVEVENVEIKGPTPVDVPGYSKKVTFGQMVDIAYKVQDSKEEIVVSTTRPETMLGDVAVAVNPNDGRFEHLRNRRAMVWHPVRKEEIPLIFDESVDAKFGTGAVKITPAHDRYDYDMAQKHGLPLVEVFDSKGMVLEGFGPFSGLPRYEARTKMLDYLANFSLLRGTKPHSMILPVCSRSKDVVEFLLRPQWFVRCDDMARRAVKAVSKGELKIVPNHFQKDWLRWLENCHDWCISRQLWWGHQIPAYEVKYGTKSTWIAAQSLEEAQKQAQDLAKSTDFELIQDPDVLDTWFSSSLLPFSTLGWPGNSEDDHFYPLSLMETGHDILFFWVARMVMLGQELTGQLPFPEILLHAIICDENGRKMSKSLGNVIKPEQVVQGMSLERLNQEAEASHRLGILSPSELKVSIEGQKKMFPKGIPECGMDALRFTLCSSNVKNHFMNFNVQECHTNRLFFNKIWQATRYTIGCAEKFDPTGKQLNRDTLTDMDLWILSRLGNTITSFKNGIDSYQFHQATAALKTFFYNNLCDVYLETTKVHMKEKQSSAAAIQCVLVLQRCLALGLYHLEVFTPHLVAELQPHLPPPDHSFIPQEWTDVFLESEIGQVLEICQAIRQAKSESLTPITRKHEPVVHIFTTTNRLCTLLQRQKDNIRQLTHSSGVVLHQTEGAFHSVKYTLKSTAGQGCSFGVETNLHSQLEPFDATNSKKLANLEAELARLLRTVNNKGYRKSASPVVQKKHADRIKQLQDEIEDIRRIFQ